MKKKILIAILAIALLTLGAFIGSLTLSKASAQTSTPTTAATPVPVVTITEDNDTPPYGRGVQIGFGGDDTAVAEKLGKTTEEMTAARTVAFEAAVADAVAAGVITQTQADSIVTNGVNGWGQLVRLVGVDYADSFNQDQYFAEALGVTVEALNQARAEVRAEQLAAAVEAGTLTQEQADRIASQQTLRNRAIFKANVRGGMMSGNQNSNRTGMGQFVDGMKNRMFGDNQNGTPGGMMGGNQPGRSGGSFGGNGSGQGLCDGTCDGTGDGICNQTNP